jgi:hypothetical protein
MSLRSRVAALLGVSTYTAPVRSGALNESAIDRIRGMFGGQLTPLSRTELRWFLADIETAVHHADQGDISHAAQLWRAMKLDAELVGVLETRTDSVKHLPKRFEGDAEMCAALQGRDGDRSVFEAMCPPAELAMCAQDALGLGLFIAELVPVEGRSYPVLVRRDPEFLRYIWAENRWYFMSIAGPIPITPGDGRWVLHVEGGRECPWRAGKFPALGSSWIRKYHAQSHKSNWEAKLANPARVAQAPAGAAEPERKGLLQDLIAWGINTVFELPVGWEVKIVESNGNGHESFDGTIDRSNREYAIAITGQIMTTDGGEGFANSDVGENRLEQLIASTCKGIAHTINTQVIPQWAIDHYGEDSLGRAPTMSWDTTPPKDEKASAEALKAFGEGVKSANESLAPYKKKLDVLALAARNGYPLVDLEEAEATTTITTSALEADDQEDDDLGAAEEDENDTAEDEAESGAEVIDINRRRAA